MSGTANLEEAIAHLTKSVDEMSDVMARQEREIALLTNRVRLLMEREAERQSEEGGQVIISDQKPPHY